MTEAVTTGVDNGATSCLVCGGRKVHYSFSIGKFRVEGCADCGLMRLNPQPTDQDLANIYRSDYIVFGDGADGQRYSCELKSNTADSYLDLIESYAGAPLTGRLLEVGCGHGDFLARAAARGLSVTGVEYSAHAVEIASNKLGRLGQVVYGDIKQMLSLRDRYNYVVLTDVLNRVRDPRPFLRNVHSLLQDDGVVVVIVPSLDSVSARLMKSRWVEFKPEHLWYFSTATLKQLLHKEGFGTLRARAAKRTFSLDYVAPDLNHHPVQRFWAVIKAFRRALPRVLQRYPIRVTASGILMFARREEIRPVKKLSIVMPAFNEVRTIRQAIDRVLSKRINGVEIEVIIVESNSTDGTQEIVREYEGQDQVTVIWQDRPRGKGNAVRAGLMHVSGDFVLIQDADDEYDIEDYDALMEPLITGEAAFVLGARHGGGAWKMRRFHDQRLSGHLLNFGHWFFATLVNIVYQLRLKDPFTMYKVFRADCLRGLQFECDRFDFDYELLIKLVRKGYRPIEIPVNYRSRSFKEGKKVDAFRDPWTWLRAIVKYRLQKLS
jgi:SAM-dependent methyltransferase